jgi:molybdenum cofactor synthesis domain-containing protein
MLDVLSRKFGGVSTVMPTVKDDISDLKFQISDSAKNADIVILTGGVSVGKYDHTKSALAELGANIFFDKVSLKPGKPAVFAKLDKTLIFGLPGNPVSAAVTFHLLVRHAMLEMQSASNVTVRGGHAVVNSAIKAAKDRDTYLPVSLATDDKGTLIATPLRSQGSSDLVSIGRADAFAFVAAGERLEAGQPTKIVYI